MQKTYEELRTEVARLQSEDRLPRRPTPEQKADWAYGNTVIENPDVTMAMAEKAAGAPPKR